PPTDPGEQQQKYHQQTKGDHPKRNALRLRRLQWRWTFRLGTERYASIRSNRFGDSVRQQLHSRTVITLFQDGNGLASEAANVAIRENWFQAIPHFNSIAVIIGCQKDQNSA